jgi:hypothetical protein
MGNRKFDKSKREEAVMTEHAVRTLLSRVRDWWRTQDELRLLNSQELGRVAWDLGLSGDALKDLVARGPDAAHLLYARMQALGMSEADVELAAHGVLRELQKTCALCNDKTVCEKDLAKHPDDPVWKSYCPNAVTLEDPLVGCARVRAQG